MEQQAFDAIVVGTGFGGAVSACRLSQAKQKVLVLERGKRYPSKSFPRNFRDVTDGWLWEHQQGLFDVRPFNEVTIVQGAGYGGGSLIYANVHLRLPPEGFSSAWPAAYTRDALDPYYDVVAYMLDINPITVAAKRPSKTILMNGVAERLGRSAQFCYPNIAVNLGRSDEMRPNKFGVPQTGCNMCGECDIGCNTHAKNTLDLNYLALAEKEGAVVRTQCEAVEIGPNAGGGYDVVYRNHPLGTTERATAARVFVCAGAVNSTELLLRCRDERRTLPDLGPCLGHRYSANGDFLAFAFGTDPPFRPSEGPTITTGIVYDRGEGDEKVWFIFQEGGYPKQIARLLSLLDPKESFLRDARLQLRTEVEDAIRERARELAGAAAPDRDGTAVFLAMGRDRADGAICLKEGGLHVTWENLKNLPLYEAEEQLSTDIARALGGRVAFNPFWHALHLPVSVHNLGGCVMSDDPSLGVTDPFGEVYGYPGLYVMDGAALPAATGVNPSHTIAAVAERNVEHVIRKILQNPTWTAPERALAKPVVDPLSKVVVPKDGTLPPETPAVGIHFTETMKGYLVGANLPPDAAPTLEEYLAAEARGKSEGAAGDFTLTITMPSVDVFLANRAHAGIARGKVHVAEYTAASGADVENGVFNLFVDGDSFYQRQMLYALPFIGRDGKPYLLDGFKDVKDHGEFDVWGSTTTLYTLIREGHEKRGRAVAIGVLRIQVADFARQLTTIAVSGARNPVEKLDAQTRFGRMFVGTLWDVFVRPRLE